MPSWSRGRRKPNLQKIRRYSGVDEGD